MKKVLIFAFITMIGQTIFAQSVGGGEEESTEIPKVLDLCYDYEYRQAIRVTGDLNTETLSLFDKLKFTKKKEQQQFHEYVKDNGFVTKDISSVSHENMYPQWYTPPYLTRIDESGLKSYLTNDPYLKGGWVGDYIDKTDTGEYKENKQTGEKYLEQAYSEKASNAYKLENKKIKELGLLYKFVFHVPSDDILVALENEGFIVKQVGDITSVRNDDMMFAWDTENKIMVTQQLEGGVPVRAEEVRYTYFAEFKNFLKTKVKIVTPKTLDNGDCYDMVEEKVYSNYSTSCQDKEVKGLQRKDELSNTEKLGVAPNPTSDFVTITFPEMNESGTLFITNLSGGVVLQRKMAENTSEYSLNVGNLVNGIYIVTVQQGNQIFTSKLIKQ